MRREASEARDKIHPRRAGRDKIAGTVSVGSPRWFAGARRSGSMARMIPRDDWLIFAATALGLAPEERK